MQKQPPPATKQHLIKPWSIRTQLMLFLCCICLVLLTAVWFLSGQLLQPYYNHMIQTHLEDQLDTIVTLMDTMSDDGIVISTRDKDTLVVNTAFQDAFYGAMESEQIRLSDLCVNIADTSLSYVLYSENVYPCLLHGDSSNLFGQEHPAETRDNPATIQLRDACFATNYVSTIITSGDWQQMVVGKTTANRQYVVFVSAGLSQVTDAGIVLQDIAPIIGVIVLFLAVLAAWIFSRWFTKPISNLTHASHAIAKGNYDVSLLVDRPDELGTLTSEFNEMAKEVHRANQFQRELMANVSHDLRTPLTLIRGYAETLRDITGAKEEKRNEQLGIIIEETDRLTKLVNSIMELSKVSSGVEPFAPIQFDCIAFCEELAERYQGICAQNNWTLLLDLPQNEPLTIYADPAMLERALDNLLGNAMHHIGEDGIFILRAAPLEGGLCHIEIEDHGTGIPQNEQKAVFERYYRSRNAAGRTGTGLGLSIAQAIFKQHGFAYGVKSELGKGSVFWLTAHCTPNH